MKHQRIVLAPDSYKGSATAASVCRAIGSGIRKVDPDIEIIDAPMADGGEGTVAALVSATGGRIISARVTGPLGQPVDSFYGILGDGKTAAIEMAAAAGLPLVPSHLRNPMYTTTYGVGELIALALANGCTRIVMGIGGSATNDGGAGMAKALGVMLLDEHGLPVPEGGAGLLRLQRVDASGLMQEARDAEFLIACDVDNPLCGKRGASAVFGPQKGATPEMVGVLDEALARYSQILERDMGVRVASVPGAGAAGGLGAGLMAFLGAKLLSGVEMVIDVSGLEKKIKGASLVITGEGRMDHQTLMGKVPWGVARVAKRHGVPAIALVGSYSLPTEALHEAGICAVFAASSGPSSLEEAMANVERNIEVTAEQIYRLYSAQKR